MGTAILEENVALFRKKKYVHALRQGKSTLGCLLWHCVAGAEKKGTQAPTAKGEEYEMSRKKSGVLRNERYTEDVDRWKEH